MKTRAITTAVLLSAFSLMLSSQAVTAQTWSPRQQEVWRAVEALWVAGTSGDVDGYYDLVSDDYRGWSNAMRFPTTKAEHRPWSVHWQSTHKVILYDMFPLAIDIHGDIAVVFFSYRALSKDKDGKETLKKGRWTDIYKKTGERWLLIADAGGTTDQ